MTNYFADLINARKSEDSVELATLYSKYENSADASHRRIGMAIAHNKHAPQSVIESIIAGDCRVSKLSVIRNHYLNERLRVILISDRDPMVRAGVAAIRDVQETILRILARDSEPAVRGAVAWNSSTPLDVLADLAIDPDENVREAVAYGWNTGISVKFLSDIEPEAVTHRTKVA